MKELYHEIVDKMITTGCTFSQSTFRDLIDSLLRGTFYIHRENEEIVTFCNWRMEEDRMFVIDCFNVIPGGLRRMIKELRKNVSVVGVSWYHKRQTEEMFRCFPKQRGAI